jgi:hypothetical protein
VLGKLLFEYGYVYTFGETGTLQIIAAINSGSVTTTNTFTDSGGSANIIGSLTMTKSPEKFDDIRVKFQQVEQKTGIVVFEDTSGATGENPCVIPLAATGDAGKKDYYPLTSDAGEVFSSWRSPDGYPIWVVESPALDATVESGISLSRALTNYYKKCSFAYRNTSGAVKNITKLRVTGNAYVIVAKNVARSSTASGKKLLEVEAEYVFTKAAAENLAKGLNQYYAYSDITYELRSKSDFALGEYVLVTDAVYSGLSSKCRIIGKTVAKSTTIIDYALEAVADFSSISITTEGDNPAAPGVPSPYAIDPAVAYFVNNTPPTNNVTGLAISSEANSDGSFNVLLEWSYTQGTVPADGFMVFFKSSPTTPGAIDVNDDDAEFVASTKLKHGLAAISARYGGAGATVRHYRFGVVAVGIRAGGVIAHAGGVVEDASWIDKTFVPEITDVNFRTYKGQGVQRRALEVDAESISFYNSPDTSPASDELLVGRIGRLGVGTDSVLMDGEFLANITSPWSAGAVINGASSSSAGYIQLADGQLRVAYRRSSDGYLVERIWSGSAWGSESIINAASSYSPEYIQLADGEIRVAYQRGSDGYLVERIWSGSAWGSESIINAANSGSPEYIQLADGQLRIAYTRNSDFYIVERIWLGSAWGSESIINAAASGYPSYIQLADGEIRVAYRRNSDLYIVERTWSGSAWGSESIINAANSAFPEYVQCLDGQLRVAYRRSSDGYLVERIWSGSAWGSESIINAASSDESSYIQLADGQLRIVYIRTSDNYLVERTLDRYAQVGAGIIESGGSGAQGDAHYEKMSNGYARIWGRHWVSTSNGSSTTRTYTVTLPINLIADLWTLEATWESGVAPIDYHAVIKSLPTAGSETAGSVTTANVNGAAQTGYGYINWHAEGRWK